MDFIKISKENLEKEHICCAISDNRDPMVAGKKNWLRARFDDGLEFYRADSRGKCFIEYIPAEKAWVPIKADGYMYIDCLWVSGSHKGNGYSDILFDECVRTSREKGKRGLCILSSDKKRGFLADPKYLKHKGFIEADRSACGITLMYLPFDGNAPKPEFLDCAKNPHSEEDGIVIYYTDQCPYTIKYVPILEKLAAERGKKICTVHIENLDEARKVHAPQTTFALFVDGEYITNEILSEAKFLKLIEK